jgi:hypothetical protein
MDPKAIGRKADGKIGTIVWKSLIFLVVLGFELKASHLQGRYTYHFSHAPVPSDHS